MKRNVKLTIEKLKELRCELKLTQAQFATKIGKFLEHSEYFDLIEKYLLK